jgi:hypothetical protein
MEDINDAWDNFCEDDDIPIPNLDIDPLVLTEHGAIPKCSALNISTKTKIAYLNQPIDLKQVFWNIPLIAYQEPKMGVVKKQMKFNSATMAEVDDIIKNTKNYGYVDEYIINQIHNPEGRSKFKDIRKLSFGICKKDINSYRCKKKSAFYNCFVVILRLLHNNLYKEIHVKVFNTGKLEIPGIQNSEILNEALTLLVEILTPIVLALRTEPEPEPEPEPELEVDALPPPPPCTLCFLDEKTETVMINSNFSCRYYINREKLHKILKVKYKINSNFDPCSYPGIQCEFYYDEKIPIGEQTGIQPSNEMADKTAFIKVSFMVFRTGSALIVGKCSELILYRIYEFLCNIFEKEYDEIKVVDLTAIEGQTQEGINKSKKMKEKTRKLRKKIILM